MITFNEKRGKEILEMNKKLILSTMFAVLMVISCTETVNYEGVESAGKFMGGDDNELTGNPYVCLLYTSPSPRDGLLSRMPSSA